MSKLWLSNQVFSSELCEYQGGYCIDTKHLRRAYKQWNHANKTLNTSREELYRVDTITTLKRSLNQRLKLIEAIYALKKIAEQSSPKDSLGYLETFGVIRSSLLKNLLDVRNEIEHNDVEPPSYERCVELLDAVWYFLRSTDEIVRVQRYECAYEATEDNLYRLYVKIHYDKNHKLEVRGWLPSDSISEGYAQNHTELEIIEVRKRADIDYGKIQNNDMAQLSNVVNSHRKQDDVFIQGFLVASNDIKRRIVRDMMCAL